MKIVTASHAGRLLPLLFSLTLTTPLVLPSHPAFASGDKKHKKGEKEPPPPYTGVKHRIAAIGIQDSAAYSTSSGMVAPPATFGAGLLEMLTSGLVECGHFQVFERSQLSDIKDELALGSSGLISPDTAIKIGKLKGIEYIITGAVTEYSNKKGGGGFNFGGLDLRSKGGTASLVVDLRIIDTASGEIIHVAHATGNSGSSGTAFGFVNGKLGLGGGGSQDNSLAKAARNSMNDGIDKICKQIDEAQSSRPVPTWEGEVLDVDVVGGKPSLVQLEGGTKAGFKVGDEVEIVKPGKEIKNKSGEVLGRKPDKHIARCRITEVQEKLMSATLSDVGDFQADDIKTYAAHRIGGN